MSGVGKECLPLPGMQFVQVCCDDLLLLLLLLLVESRVSVLDGACVCMSRNKLGKRCKMVDLLLWYTIRCTVAICILTEDEGESSSVVVRGTIRGPPRVWRSMPQLTPMRQVSLIFSAVADC